MKFLITGGAGFIGVHAAARFSKDHEVVIVDDLSRKGSAANLEWLRSGHRFTFVEGDIRRKEVLADATRKAKPDAVLHLAAQVAVTTSVVDPRTDFEINALGTFNVLEAVRNFAPEAVLLYASTNKVYGGMEQTGIVLRNGHYEYQDLPNGVSEEQPLDFHSPYGCSKGAADQYVRDYGRIYGLRTIVFRQSCIYGTHQFGVEDQGWIAWFTICAVTGKPVTIYGDGRQVRDVLWVGDLLNAYEAAVNRADKVRGSIFNLGGGRNNVLSLLDTVEILQKLTGKPLSPAFSEWRPGDQRVFVADTRKAEKELGWKAKVAPREGVAQLYDWVVENRGLFPA